MDGIILKVSEVRTEGFMPFAPSQLMSMWETTQTTYHKTNMGYSPENLGLENLPNRIGLCLRRRR